MRSPFRRIPSTEGTDRSRWRRFSSQRASIPNQANVFLQSHVPAHAELGWLMTTLTYMGELERMTQFKEKSAGKESIGAGLFVYPALMAADILLYHADLVPVGDDQKQHLELTRIWPSGLITASARHFKLPEPYIPEVGAKHHVA